MTFLTPSLTHLTQAPTLDDEVRKSEERLRLAQDVGGVASWEFDLDTGDVEWSRSGYRLYGLAPEWRPSYANFLALVHPEDRERVGVTVERALRDKSEIDHQFRILTPAGEQRWVVSRARFFPGASGDKTRLVGIDIDVTALKRTEQLLEEQRNQLERIEKLACVGGLIVDLHESDRSNYSAGYKRLHGLGGDAGNETRAQWAGRIHPEDRARIVEQFDRALATGVDCISSEYRIVRPGDGEIRWIEALADIERDASGIPLRLVGAHRDVTKRKAAEEAMIVSERRLRRILDAMPQIVALIRADGSHVHHNTVWRDYTGLDDAAGDGIEWRRAFHPQDLPNVEAALARAVAADCDFEIEARLRHRSGEYRWHLCRAVPLRDAGGRTEHWLGVCADIHGLQEAHDLIANELLHRMKNVFSLVSALATLCAADAPEAVQRFAGDFRNRLQSLSAALLYLQPGAQTQEGQTIMGLLRALLTPFGLAEGRIVLAGEDAPLDGIGGTTMALLLHELGTNAAKYGALSRIDGVVTLTVATQADELALTWRERGGPHVEGSPERAGFGSELISRLLARQPGSRFDYAWEQEGLTATLRLRRYP